MLISSLGTMELGPCGNNNLANQHLNEVTMKWERKKKETVFLQLK